jgi:5-methylcytosine-specific restriction endonuclease McrA
MAHNWNTSDRVKRLPGNWGSVRKRILARDSTCMICGIRESTVVDHIEPKTDDHSDEALQGVCEPCHRQKTAKEAAAFRAATPRPTTNRPDERHPGLL